MLTLYPVYREFFFQTLAVAVCVMVGVPPVPVTVNVYVPLGTDDGTETVNVDELLAGFGLKLALLPDGKPLTERVIEALKPPLREMLTV